ncbi:hydroxymethylglutaryl-CoA synthase [Brachybacterium sp. JHP9]|uniref:Hydroxymethylglutaryl-CoA synthase n=1 Tax=Brachybacterium equifaecis TaxID=2910770 RepID=A0ABT0R1L4_9MICO|nr:hydroxymethylglutaryl-CoA synthase [Brachybacterium equifaecis]MCL6423823.1 hydroxymethylglutaryl-CoA synthase [Brachybacterium equifaecis]
MTTSPHAPAAGAVPIGIEDLEIATGHHVLDLSALAETRGVDPAKYSRGLGQDEMSLPAADEDVVTMGAAAASALLERTGIEGIRTLLFATESGIDHSKSAAVIAHGLLGLPPHVRSVELKQACYAGMAAVQSAIGIVARRPQEKVLVIASDVARYQLASPGEPTQGAGAVAMVISADPALLEIEPISGVYSADIDDFWRPNDSSTAVVDGRLSMGAYQKALMGAWEDLQAQGGPSADQIDAFVYHQPFTKMARKAHRHLSQKLGAELDETPLDQAEVYNRRLGNTYTASLWNGLASLLDHAGDLAGKRVALFSYGSGSAGEMLTGIVRDQGDAAGRRARRLAMLDAREPLAVDAYEELHRSAELSSASDQETPQVGGSGFRFAGIQGRARRYERPAG